MDRGTRTDVPPSEHFRYHNGVLHCDDVPLPEIAKQHGSPTFVYAARYLDAAFSRIEAAIDQKHIVAYAVKANSNLALLARLAAKGCGADIVSVGELHRCLKVGFNPQNIVFSGVAKRDDEIEAALSAGIRAIHVESVAEIDAIETIATRRGTVAPITLRVNPDVSVETHPYIATGIHGTKFGLRIEAARALLPRLVKSPHLQLEGVACHIGSQLPDAEPMAEAVAILTRFARDCIAAGANLRSIDAGGGWPIHYGDEDAPMPSWRAFGEAISEGMLRGGGKDLDLELIVEPGRAFVGDAGGLLTRVVFVKEQDQKRFIIVDAGMNDLVRPALYDAYHAIMPVQETDGPMEPADLVGPVCESGDFFAIDRPLPKLKRGDLVLIRGAGAYGMSMASTYNARPLIAETLIDGADCQLVRRRQTVEDLWRDEIF